MENRKRAGNTKRQRMTGLVQEQSVVAENLRIDQERAERVERDKKERLADLSFLPEEDGHEPVSSLGTRDVVSGLILGVGIITLVSTAAITAKKKASLRRKRLRRGSQRYH